MTQCKLGNSTRRVWIASALGFALLISSGCNGLGLSKIPGMSAMTPGQQDAAVKKRAEADKFPTAQQSGI